MDLHQYERFELPFTLLVLHTDFAVHDAMNIAILIIIVFQNRPGKEQEYSPFALECVLHSYWLQYIRRCASQQDYDDVPLWNIAVNESQQTSLGNEHSKAITHRAVANPAVKVVLLLLSHVLDASTFSRTRIAQIVEEYLRLTARIL